MGEPRQVLAGTTYFITRRCSQRAFRLVPRPALNAIVMYSLALALMKTSVRLHAACAMSNHVHLVVTDTLGELPMFLREFHRSAAKAINALQGKSENLWACQPCSAIVLADEESIIAKIAYVVTNPVSAGLVHDLRAWPGVLLWKESTLTVSRPAMYFSVKGRSPPQIRMQVSWPSRSGHASSSFRRRIKHAIAHRIAEKRASMAKAGMTFLGRARVLAQSVAQVALRPEVRESRPSRVIAAVPERHRILVETYAAFRSAYRNALMDWRSGLRSVVFPSGTWWMRVHHCARVRGDAERRISVAVTPQALPAHSLPLA